MTTNFNSMESFLERYGILRSWIAANIGIHPAVFSQAMWVRKFSDEEADRIVGLLRATGRKLQSFKFGADHRDDIRKLKDEFGLKMEWIAKQAGFKRGSYFHSALERSGGLRREEIETIEYALQDVARAMIFFEFPKSLRKAA